jgi:hypothetical protein
MVISPAKWRLGHWVKMWVARSMSGEVGGDVDEGRRGGTPDLASSDEVLTWMYTFSGG